jgi:hypothetical protein
LADFGRRREKKRQFFSRRVNFLSARQHTIFGRRPAGSLIVLAPPALSRGARAGGVIFFAAIHFFMARPLPASGRWSRALMPEIIELFLLGSSALGNFFRVFLKFWQCFARAFLAPARPSRAFVQ